MIKFERMSNKTRDHQRPPKLVPQADAAFLAAYRRAKPVKKPPQANNPGQPKPVSVKPENSRPTSLPAFPSPARTLQPPAKATPPARVPPAKPENQPSQGRNGERPDQHPLVRNSRPGPNGRDFSRPKAEPPQPSKPQPETQLPEKKPELPARARLNIPPYAPSGKSITDSSLSAPSLPSRTLPSNGFNGKSGSHGIPPSKTNGSGPPEKQPEEKKGGEDQSPAPEKRPDVPENKPISSLWSKDVIPVQIPMNPPSHLTFTNGSNNHGLTVKPDSEGRFTNISPRVENAGRGGDRARLGLDYLLKQHIEMPVQTAVLGVCDDGLPVLLDLNDPTSGAVLVISDEREAQLDMLRIAVASMADRGTPSNVQFLVFTCEPEMWRVWIAERGFNRHCLAIVGAEDEDAVREWVIRLADWTEQRRAGQRSGPPVLVVMDSLSFLPRLAYDVRLNFDWLGKEGPAARIWPLGAISSDLATALGTRMLRGFETRILGFAGDPAAYMRFAGLDEKDTAQFGQHGTFAIQTGDSWLRFHLPRLP